MTKTRSVGFSLVVALTLVAPLVAGGLAIFVASARSPLESAATAAPLIGQVESAQRFQEVQVAIAVEEAPSWSPTSTAQGTVTTVGIGAGSQVATGTVIATINDASIVAYTGTAPLFRDITRGQSGRDVATAQDLLTELGFPAGTTDGKAGPTLEAAIFAFNNAYGYGTKNPVLSLASLTWVGTKPVTVSTTPLQVGQVVDVGDTLFTTNTGLAAITVTEPSAVPQGTDLVLTVGQTTVPYVGGIGRVTDADAVAAIAAYLGSSADGVGTLRLAQPRMVATVPASAVVSDATGAICMFPDATAAPLAVTPLGGTLGTVDLDASLVGTAVLLNPREVRTDLTCGD